MIAEPALRGSHVAPREETGVLLAIFDYPVLSAGFRAVIDDEPGMRVVGEAASLDEVAVDVASCGPDVVVAECRAGNPGCGTTYESIERIRAACPDLRILAVECRCAPQQFPLAFKAGANGFLSREARPVDVRDAIRSLVAGHTYVSPLIVTRMVDAYVRRTPGVAIDDPYDTLTDREREVLRLAAMGHTNREIARTLGLSEQTVHSQRASLMEKLDLHNRVDLLRYSIRRGLLDAGSL